MLCFTLGVNAHAQDGLNVYIQDVHPYAYLDNNQAKGPIVDMVKDIDAKLDQTFNIRLVPHKRITQEPDMQRTNLIVAFGCQPIKDTHIVASLFEFDVAMMIRSDTTLNALKQQPFVTVAAVSGRHSGIRGLFGEVRYIDVKNYEQALQLLQKNRVDVVVGLEDEISRASRVIKDENNSSMGATHIVDTIRVQLYVPDVMRTKPYVEKLKAQIEKMKNNGELNKLSYLQPTG